MKEILLSRPFSASPLEFNMHFQEMMAEIFAENIPQVYRDCRFRIARSLTVPIHFRLTRRLRAQHLSFSKDPTAKTPSAQQVKAVEHGSTLICAAAPSPSAPRLLRSSLLSADSRTVQHGRAQRTDRSSRACPARVPRPCDSLAAAAAAEVLAVLRADPAATERRSRYAGQERSVRLTT